MLRSKNILSILALTCLSFDEITGRLHDNVNRSATEASIGLTDGDISAESLIPPNIDLFQEESLSQETFERSLITNNGQLPFGFLLTRAECPLDIVMTGFGMRDSTNFVVSGYLDFASVGTDCQKLLPAVATAGQYHNFVSSQSATGLVTWYKSITSAEQVFLDGMTIASDNVLVVYRLSLDTISSTKQFFRVLRLSISTGAWAAEMRVSAATVNSASSLVVATNGVQMFRSSVTSSTARNYVSCTFTSNTVGFLKFDENFSVPWIRTINNNGASPLHLRDMDVHAGGQFSIAYGFLASATEKSKVFLFNETTGETIDEMEAPGQAVLGNYRGVVRLNNVAGTSGLKYYVAFPIRLTSQGDYSVVQLAAGDISYAAPTFSLAVPSAKKATGMFLEYPQLEVVTDSRIVFTAIERPYRPWNTILQEVLHIWFLDASLVVTDHNVVRRGYYTTTTIASPFPRALMRYFTSTSKSSAVYLALNTKRYFNQIYPGRIVFFKVMTNSKEIYSSECASAVAFVDDNSGASYTFATTWTIIASGSFTPNAFATTSTLPGGSTANTVYYLETGFQKLGSSPDGNIIAVSDSATSLSSLTLVKDTYVPQNAYVQTNTASGSNVVISNTGYGNSLPIANKFIATAESAPAQMTVAVAGCKAANTYKCTSMRYPNDTAVNLDTSDIAFTTAASGDNMVASLTLKTFTGTSITPEYVGSRSLKLQCTIDSTESLNPFLRYNIAPPLANDNVHQATAFVDPTNCATPVFPIHYGHNLGNVQLNYIGANSDSTQMLIAGEGNVAPFSGAGTVNQGFIGLLDAYGQPNWIYYASSDTKNKQSSCYHASEAFQTDQALSGSSGTNFDTNKPIFGVCKVFNQEFGEYQGMVVALTAKVGYVRFAKFLPRDHVASSSGIAGTFDSVSSPIYVTQLANGDLLIGTYYRYAASTYRVAFLRTAMDGTRRYYSVLLDPSASSPFNVEIFKSPTSFSQLFLFAYGSPKMLIRFDIDSDAAPWSIAHANDQKTQFLTFPDSGTTTQRTKPGFNLGSGTVVLGILDRDVAVSPATYRTKNSLDLFEINPDTLAVVKSGGLYLGITRTFTSVATWALPTQAAVTTNFINVFITGLEIFIYMTVKFNAAAPLITVIDYRVWEVPSVGASYTAVGGQLLQGDSVIFGVQGKWTPTGNSSSIIFRFEKTNDNAPTSLIDMNDFSCVAFRQPVPTEYTYDAAALVTLSYDFTTNNAFTTGAVDVIDSSGDYENGIYSESEWFQDANSVNLQTFTYSQPYEWGFNLIPSTYDFRVPQLKQQCGSYVRQNSFNTASAKVQRNNLKASLAADDGLTINNDFGTFFIEVTLGQVGYYRLTTPLNTCQLRPMNIKVFTAGNDTSKIEQSWITFNPATRLITINAGKTAASRSTLSSSFPYTNGRRDLMGNSMTDPEAGTYALIVRYEDKQNPNTYYDHPLIVRVYTDAARNADSLKADYECYQNPYPSSFGGCSSTFSSSKCQMEVYDFHSEDIDIGSSVFRTNTYIAGSVARDAKYMTYPFRNKNDAFILMLNDAAMPQWYQTFSLSRLQNDAVTAVIKLNDFVYGYMTSMNEDYRYRQNAIIKLEAVNGMLNDQFSLNLYSRFGGAFYINDVRNIYSLKQTAQYNIAAQSFSFNFIYTNDRANSKRIGTVRIKDTDNTGAITGNSWSLDEFYSLREENNYDYVAGMQLYTEGTPSNSYWEAHLAQPSGASTSFMYLFNMNAGVSTIAQYVSGLRFKLTGTVSSSQSLQPKLLWDKATTPNLYSAFLTSSNAYLFKYNFTYSATETQFLLYTFTQLSSAAGDLLSTGIIPKNIDMIYNSQNDNFLVILNANSAKGLIFFQVNRLDMTVVANTKVRYDNLPGSTTPGMIAFVPKSSTQANNFFQYVKNSAGYANAATKEVLVNRKAFLYSEDNKFDCSASGYLGTPSINLALHVVNSANCAYLTSAVAAFASDAQCVQRLLQNDGVYNPAGNTRQLMYFTDPHKYYTTTNTLVRTPYVSSVYMSDYELVNVLPQQQNQGSGSYAIGAEECAKGTGVQKPTTTDLTSIQANLGSTGNPIVNRASFMQCQAKDISYTFYYEDGKSVQNAENIFVSYNSTTKQLSYDLSTYKPAPGVRLLQYVAKTQNDNREVRISQPFIIRPSTYSAANDAPVSATLPLTCTADNDFPRIIGDLQKEFIQYSSDIHAVSANVLICGDADPFTFPNSHWATQGRVAVNTMGSLNGNIYWSYAVSYIMNDFDGTTNYQDLSYRQCRIADTTNVFSLLYMKDTKNLVLVKQSFAYGTYKYAKKIPGEYSGDYFGFSLISITTPNVELYGYVFGKRTDGDLNNYVNHFSKFRLDADKYPYQVWNAYSNIADITTKVDQSIQKMGASTDAVFALSHFQRTVSGTSTQYANIVKYDGISGQQLESMTYLATGFGTTSTTKPQLSFVVDYPNRLIYLSSATIESGSVYKRYIRRFDLALVPDDSVKFSMTVDTTKTVQFVSEMDYNDTHLFETFKFVQDTYYLVVYLRQTLDIQAFIQFYSSQVNVLNLGIKFFNNGGTSWLLHSQSSMGFLTKATVNSAVMTRIVYRNDGKLIDPNACLNNYYTDLLTTITSVATNNVVDNVGAAPGMDGAVPPVYTYYYSPSYYKLQPQQFLYFEQKLYPEQMSFKPALNFECASPGLVFPEELQHQVIQLPMNRGEDKVYSFYLPSVCNANNLAVVMSVDKFDNLPAFLSGSKEVTPEGIFYRVVFSASKITDAVAGTYNIKIQLTFNSATAVDYFVLHIYPSTPYGANVNSFECQNKYNFMSYGNAPGALFKHINLNTASQDYVLCGANKIANVFNVYDSPADNANPQLKYNSFLQYNTQGHAVKWHINLQAGRFDNIAQFCQISGPIPSLNNQQLIYTVANSENQINQPASQFNNTIYLFQHGLNAQFRNAKEIRNQKKNGNTFDESLFQAEGFFLDNNGNLFVSGVADGYTLSHNSPGFFILKLDPLFNVLFYSVFDFGSVPSGGELSLITGTNTLYSVFGYKTDSVNALRWGVLALDATLGEVTTRTESSGTIKNAWTLANGTEVNRNTTRQFYQQGLVSDNAANVYTCLIYKGSEIHDEIALTKHDAVTLRPKGNLEFSRGFINLEACNIQIQSATGNLVMAVGTFEYTHIFGFDVSTNDLKNITSVGLAYYHQRFIPFKVQMFESNNVFSLYIRTMGFDQNDDRIFFTKFRDVQTPAWQAPCDVSQIQLVTTATFYLSYNTPVGVGVNEFSKWVSVDFAFKKVSNLTINDYYLGNPGTFIENVITNNNYVYRANFLNCSRYSFPVVPTNVIAADSGVKSFTQELVVQDAAYVLKFNPFQSCSYDTIIHKVTYKNNQPIDAFLVFDPSALTLTIRANSNAFAGVYVLRFAAYDDGAESFLTYYDFNLTIKANQPPYPLLNGFTNDFTLYTGHTKQWIVNLDFDVEGNDAIFSAMLLDTTGVQIIDPVWFKVLSTNATTLVVQAAEPPLSNAQSGDQYYVNLTVADKFNIDTPRTYQVSVLVKPNSAPVLDTTKQSLTLPTNYVRVPFTFTLRATDFIDFEGDTPVFNCDIITSAGQSKAWITETRVGTTSVTYSGMTTSNDQNGQYVFVCAVTDEFLPTINIYQFILPVAVNTQVKTTPIAPQTVRRSDYHIWAELQTACIDPENQPITRSLTVVHPKQGTITTFNVDSGIVWDPTVPYLAFSFTDSTKQAGSYTFTMTCSDGFNTPAPQVTFTLTATDNLAPTVSIPAVNPLAGFTHVTTVATYGFQADISTLFTDPEGEELYFEVQNQDGSAVDPNKLQATVQNKLMIVNVLAAASNTAQTFNLRLIAFDPLGQSVSTPFTIVIYACDPTCLTCDGGLSTNCLTCNSAGTYKYFYSVDRRCYPTCPIGTYLEVATGQCRTCAAGCSECTGPSETTQCSVCATNYYLYPATVTPPSTTQGCYEFCPIGFRVDPVSKKCIAQNTQLYKDCVKFIGNMTNYVTNPFVDSPTDLQTTSQTVSCAGGLTWNRIFAVQCRETVETTPQVYIQVYTNSLPPTCVSKNVAPQAQQVNFEVKFSVPTTAVTTKFDMKDQTIVNNQLCRNLDWTSTDKLSTAITAPIYGYTRPGVAQFQVPLGIIGVAVNGVPIHAGTSEFLSDWALPKAFGTTPATRVAVDECLGTYDTTGTVVRRFYHYYSNTPCIWDTSKRAAVKSILQNCDSLTSCNNDPVKYANSLNYPKNLQRRDNFFGIALDGHMIMGAYKEDYTLFQPCDVDACNGLMMYGHYVYASTMFYPYTVACWGPATDTSKFGAACSNNNNVCQAQSSSIFGLAFNFMLVLAISFFVLF